MNQLYILNEENNAVPVSWQEYDAWEESIPKEHRSALGRRIEQTHIGPVMVVTVFVATPIGYYGRKPQLWLTLSVGPEIWEERRYSSHRAALQGHAAACREITRQNTPKPTLAESV